MESRRIVAIGSHVEHWLNGVKLLEYEQGSPAWTALVAKSKFAQWPPYGLAMRGHIGLQDHGDVVEFKNIRIRSSRDDQAQTRRDDVPPVLHLGELGVPIVTYLGRGLGFDDAQKPIPFTVMAIAALVTPLFMGSSPIGSCTPRADGDLASRGGPR